MKKVLITGMSGIIGSDLRRLLEDVGGYELSALNRSPVEGVKWFQADIADLKEVEKACVGQDTVVHLSAHLPDGEDGDIWEGNLSSNIIGTYNIYEAARRTGVKRVIFASSGAVMQGYYQLEPYKALREQRYADVPSKFTKLTESISHPGGIYGATKVWGEALGRVYSDDHEVSIICVRIARVVAEDRPMEPADYSRWGSKRDLSDMIQKCIEVSSDVRFDVFNFTSNNKWGYLDLEHAKEVLGWTPQDSADPYL